MSGEERRNKIISLLKDSNGPYSGGRLSKELGVSRQVIVQDIALIRAMGYEIDSTYRGYIINGRSECARVFKTIHSDEDVAKELTIIIDEGGKVKDVFVYHKVYGIIRGELNIQSRRDIDTYLTQIANGKSKLLKNTTSGYHYHTVVADSDEILDRIQEELSQAGFLAQLQDYEPVNFWGKENK